MSYPSLLPANAVESERALEQVMAHAGDQPIDIRIVKNADLCPLELLPWTAWENAITYWNTDWTESQQRGIVSSAAVVNKTRGTPGAVKRALSSMDVMADLVEWFNDSPKGDPYTFRIVIHSNSITDDEIRQIIAQVSGVKNARSYLTGVLINEQKISGKYYIGGAIYTRQSVTIKAKAR